MNRKDWTFVHEGPGDRTLSLNGYDILLPADKEQTELLTSNSCMCCPGIMCKGPRFLNTISMSRETDFFFFMILSNNKAELSLRLSALLPPALKIYLAMTTLCWIVT